MNNDKTDPIARKGYGSVIGEFNMQTTHDSY